MLIAYPAVSGIWMRVMIDGLRSIFSIVFLFTLWRGGAGGST